jgi:Zn-dependent M32 family carboxypeptidase
MTNQQKLKELFKILDERDAYSRSIGKLNFDMQCCAPPNGMAKAGEDIALLGRHLHEITHSKAYTDLLCSLHADSEGLSLVQKKLIERLYDNYQKEKNITPEFSYKMDLVLNSAYGKWLTAKQAKDFSLFRDSFAELIDCTRQAIELREDRHGSYYEECLDDYEKGTNEKQLDEFFAALKSRILPLVKRIMSEGKPIRDDFLNRRCPVCEQEAFSKYLLEKEGLKSDALVLMTTEHPFTTNFGPQDVRVTTHYYEQDFISNIFSTLHEGGHAMFMQNEPQEFYDNHASDGMSCAMHECISRFYENIIGRSEAFIHFIYPKLLEISPSLADVSERELYAGVNISRPSLIRTDADELTYSIHVMIRYEIERDFINGNISVDDIPAIWNSKYKEYLGIDVPSDDLGCLQDVHWTGMFGYFPSYALGSAYGAQIMHRMQQDFDVYGEVSKGELGKIAEWLKDRVFSHASISRTDEWLQRITGESFNVNYYLDYLEDKYTKLYELK